jgi:hypothetical protein
MTAMTSFFRTHAELNIMRMVEQELERQRKASLHAMMYGARTTNRTEDHHADAMRFHHGPEATRSPMPLGKVNITLNPSDFHRS